MFRSPVCLLLVSTVFITSSATFCEAQQDQPLFLDVLEVDPPHITTDKTITYDYDIVYVRAQRAGDEIHKRYYTDIAQPLYLEPGADLMLLHPDGSEEVLVEGGEGSVTDPVISLDGAWVIYTQIYSLAGSNAYQPARSGADIFKLHLKSRKVVKLTDQRFTPNTGAADWSSDYRTREKGKTHLDYGVMNFGAFPLPGGKIVFTSNRNAFRPPRAYPRVTLQLFVMDDDGNNVEQIGYLNLAGALHPVVLSDGRIIFSSLESQGIRNRILWGIWSINADGTSWAPVVSAFDPGGAPNAFHFQSQLSDGSVIVEEYYNQNNSGFGAYIKLPLSTPAGQPKFGPAYMRDPRNRPLRFGRHYNGKGKYYRMPFMPAGAASLTPFALNGEGPADPSVLGDKKSAKVGKVTHPSGAPDNHLLTVWSPGPTNHQYKYLPQLDGGIYLIKDGQPVSEPGQMRLIKNDPNHNEQWPRAVVPYKRIYGIDEPATIPRLPNDGHASRHLPAGTPFALIGTSSMYKRESYPNGVVPPGEVTSTFAGDRDTTGFRDLDPFNTSQNRASLNWSNQGADAGVYSNRDIHAIRILAMEPTTDRHRGDKSGRLFHSHAMERLRILGEIPVRKFTGDQQPLDPDGNPDTSFLAEIPADTAFTFQTIDRHGMVLNMSQTWHQLRPGEVRHDCGGCHAHSQQPTRFLDTAAARPDYQIWDLVNETPLLVDKSRDPSEARWDAENQTGLRRVDAGVANVEYFRDVQPILQRSCVACHTEKHGDSPSGNLNLDADDQVVSVPNQGRFPGTYYRLALDAKAQFGHRPVIHNGTWRQTNASRYIRKFQSRRSLLVWKIHGRRLDGWTNDDFPSATVPGDATTLQLAGEPIENTQRNRDRSDLDYRAKRMPPPEAIADPKLDVKPLSDEDRRTIVRWIDLGCPIDLDYDADHPDRRGFGWMCDDNRPVLSLTSPQAGENRPLDRILLGMHDYDTGLDMSSLSLTANFQVNGIAAGRNLAPALRPLEQGVWQLPFDKPLSALPGARLVISVKDRQGNTSRIDRRFSVAAE